MSALKVLAIVLALAAASSCGDRDRAPAPVEPAVRSALLTIVASPVAGTAATAVADITCPLTLRIEGPDGQAIRGTFERRQCTALLTPTSDASGSFLGTVGADGKVSLVFAPAPLSSSAAVNTSGGCRSEEGASGPYEGRFVGPGLDVVARFRLYCAGLPVPAPPSFDMEYRITTP